MWKKGTAIAVLLFFALTASAKVGDNLEKLKERYGSKYKTYKGDKEDKYTKQDILVFEKKTMTVKAVLLNDKCIRIDYKSKKKMSESTRNMLFSAHRDEAEWKDEISSRTKKQRVSDAKTECLKVKSKSRREASLALSKGRMEASKKKIELGKAKRAEIKAVKKKAACST